MKKNENSAEKKNLELNNYTKILNQSELLTHCLLVTNAKQIV